MNSPTLLVDATTREGGLEVDALTFRADATTPGTKRTALLRLEGRAETVRATVLWTDEDEPLLMLRLWVGEEVGYTYYVVDRWARVCVDATGPTHDTVAPLIHERLAAKGIALKADEAETLLADHVDGSRRTSILRSEDDTIRLRAKLMLDESEYDDLLHLRAEFTERGFVHVVIDQQARLCAKSSGKTDSDTWTRIEGELNRMEYELI